MTQKQPEIRYTVGPEALSLGDLPLVRADLDGEAAGWRPTSPDMAAQAILPGRVAEFGFEARNYTPETPAAVQTSAPAGTSPRTSRNKSTSE